MAPSRRLGALSLAALLAACGGGDEAARPGATTASEGTAQRARPLATTLNPGGWVAIAEPNDRLLQNLTIPADAPVRGMWSASASWPMVGLHQAILPDGKVLTWGTTPDGGGQNGRYFDVWDPNLGLTDPASHALSFDATRQDSFCAPAVYTTDGRLMITGGNGTGNNGTTSQYYAAPTRSFARGPNVADARWYATMLMLADGRPIVLGGINPYTEGQWGNPDFAVSAGQSSMTPEVLENGNWRSLFGAQSRLAFGPDNLRSSLPKAWVAPDGRVFGIASDQLFYVDPNANGGNGATTIPRAYKAPPGAGYTNDTAPNVGPTMSAVMYAPGRVLAVGGNGHHNGQDFPSSRMATSIDLNGGGAVLTEQPRMAFARNFANVIVLPDGKVLATGGETRSRNDPAFGVYAAESWDPSTGNWTTLASARNFRGYHSQTALLTNGTVLSTGGGNPGPVQLNGEVFYPPYLFRSVNGSAQLAPRPRLVGISGLSHASGAALQFDMAGTEPVSQVVLIGLSVGTHSFNSGQRRVPLAFGQEGIRVTATLPVANLAPPGYYQLIALDANGVPSRGTIIAIGQGVAAPAVPVTPYTPPAIGGTIDAPLLAAGGTARYTVPAEAGVTYSWNFGDGSAVTAFTPTASTTHVFANPGVYAVTLTARAANGATTTRSFLQAVHAPVASGRPMASSATALEPRSGAAARLWVANPDTDTVAVIDTGSNTRVAEIAVGASPRAVAVAPDGRVWVTNKGSSTISIVSPATLSVATTVALPRAAQPHGLVFAPGGAAYVVLEATGQLLRLDPASGSTQATLAIGPNPRHLAASADGATLLVSRFITPALPGEGSANVDTGAAGAEVLSVDGRSMAVQRRIVLRHSDKVDNEVQGAGIPNYLAAPVISPDGRSAWVPSKQDNIRRGTLRNGQPLDFQNSVRAISSRIDLAAGAEDYARRIDHDNSSLGTAAAFHPTGAYMFVALETSRQVAVVDPVGGRELAKVDVGRAPQAVAVSADGTRLYVQNFMDRSVSVLDLGPLVTQGRLTLPVLATVRTIGVERLPAQVLLGKQHFYDARDPRLARDSYMSCASCHADGGHDGRTWDFTGLGEGLRNTPALTGRAGGGQGFVHWSANFDEIQDFEGQIRAFAGGTGLMTDAQFNTGTRNTPLGDRKTGISADLDALAAYLGSLNRSEPSPYRAGDGSLTAAAAAGKAVFASANCASCHGGTGFTISGDAGTLRNIGTIKPASGRRLGGTLGGIDVPGLRDVWSTAPYLHDGSAPTLDAAVQAHAGTAIAAGDLANLVAYLQQIGGEEPAPGGTVPTVPSVPPASATTCAGENGTCTLPAGTTGTVWYGAGSSWAVRTGVSGSIACNNAVFGDPLFGTVKSCRYEVNTPAPVPVAPTGLAGAWAFDDGSGTRAIDRSGANRAITLSNAGWTTGRLGGAAQFNGINASGSTDAAVVNTAQSFAVAAWVRPEALTGWRTFVNQDGVNVSGFWLQYSEFLGSKFALTMHDVDSTSSSAFRAVGTTTPVAGTWYHVVGVRDKAAGTLKLYVNGRLEATAAYAGGWASSGPLNVGRGKWGAPNDWWQGGIDEVRVYNGVLSDAEVAQLHAQGVPPANQAPTVSLTAPGAATSVVQGSTVTVSATAADPDGSIARVEFYAGSTLVATDASAPYSATWSAASTGSTVLTARAVDNAGAATTSAGVTVTVTAPPLPTTGGLLAQYFANTTLGGSPVLARVENPSFDWGTGSPGPAVPADNFSVRWSGSFVAPATGTYRFRTRSDDGVRLWVDGVQRINNWTDHAPTLDTSAGISLVAGRRYTIVLEYYERGGGAVMQLTWQRPGSLSYVALPGSALSPP